MSLRDQNGSTPTSWLHVAGFVLVLWAVSSDVLAQAREMLVSDLRGTVMKTSGSRAQAVRLLDTLKVGERLRLSSDSRVGLFAPAEALMFVVDGPAEVAIGPRGVTANGKPAGAQKLDQLYRSLRFDSAELVQGSLVMRSAGELAIQSPEGPVPAADARTLRWKGDETWIVELAKDGGDLVYRGEAKAGRLELPANIVLEPGIKYVWGLVGADARGSPADWTEFRIEANVPVRANRVVHAVWLRENGMPRAALRELQGAR